MRAAKAVPLVFAQVNTWPTPLWPTLCRCAEFRIPACGDRILVLGSDTDPTVKTQGPSSSEVWPLPPPPPRKTLVKFGPPPRVLGRDNRTRAGGRQADAEVLVHGGGQVIHDLKMEAEGRTINASKP
jgi:hypothetical protein